MRALLAITMALPAWAATCTLTNNAGSACASKSCTLSAIAADGGRGYANWSGGGSCATPGYIPVASDAVVIPDTYTLTADQAWDFGGSGAAYYSYVSSVSVESAGTGYSGTCVATFSGGSPMTNIQTATCTFSGGGLSTVTVSAPLRWYSVASVAPTVAITCSPACGGAGGAAVAVVWQQGSGGLALSLNRSGKLILAGAVTLRGTGGYTGYNGASEPTALEFRAGSSLTFDNSSATPLADGNRPYYTFGQIGESGYRAIANSSTTPCTGQPAVPLLGISRASTRCAVNNGGFSTHGAYWGGRITLDHVDFTNVGDSYLPAFHRGSRYGNANWDVQYSTFTDCGGIWDNTSSPDAAIAIRHKYNTHTRTKMDGVFRNVIWGHGTVELVGNVWDVMPGYVNGYNASGSGTGLTVRDNLFNVAIQTASGSRWAAFDSNLMRCTKETEANCSITMMGDFSNTYWINDPASGGSQNAHVTISSASVTGNITISGDVLESTDGIHGDQGEAYGGAKAGTSNTVSKTLMLPSASGYSWASIASSAGFGAGTLCSASWGFSHNTFWGLHPQSGANNGVFGMLQTSETCTPAANLLTAFKSNLLYSPSAHGEHLINSTGSTNVREDLGVGNISHNNNWNGEGTRTACSWCNNQGNGYVDKYSAGNTPGASDFAVDPQFVDPTRTFAVFDQQYLGRARGTEWESGGSYAYGEIVSHAVAGTYFGQTINYRCINLSGCSEATNQEPGTLYPTVAWRSNWRFAALDYIGAYLGANYTPFGDYGLVIDGQEACDITAPCSAIRALGNWVKAGYAVQNPVLWGAGHDGKDIGAVHVDGARRAPLAAILP